MFCLDPPECQHGDIEIAGLSYLRLNDGSVTIVGQPEVCIGDELIPLCNASLTYETAQRICQYYGLISMLYINRELFNYSYYDRYTFIFLFN